MTFPIRFPHSCFPPTTFIYFISRIHLFASLIRIFYIIYLFILDILFTLECGYHVDV